MQEKAEMEKRKGTLMTTSISSGKWEARSFAKNEQVGMKVKNWTEKTGISTLRNMLAGQIRIN